MNLINVGCASFDLYSASIQIFSSVEWQTKARLTRKYLRREDILNGGQTEHKEKKQEEIIKQSLINLLFMKDETIAMK